MRFYHRFVDETLDDNGTLQQFSLHYPDNFNFGYDVVDAIADEAPQRRALVWCNQRGDERIFTFSEIKELSNRAANFFRAQGVKQGDRVMVMLKRHHEYCTPSSACTSWVRWSSPPPTCSPPRTWSTASTPLASAPWW